MYELGETPWDTKFINSPEVDCVEDSVYAIKKAFDIVNKLENNLNDIEMSCSTFTGFGRNQTIDELIELVDEFISTSKQLADTIDGYLPELEEYKKGLIDINRNFVPYERPY